MKKIVYLLLMALTITLVGCGKTSDSTNQTEDLPAELNDLTFENLSNIYFEFSSGAGGWSEEININSDGSFSGRYHDSEMGDAGEGYENGTMYICSYTGHFADLEKVDDYTYQMTLTDLNYDETPGEEVIEDEIRFINSTSYGMVEGDTYTVYLPGKNISDIDEEIWMWLAWANGDNEEALANVAIANEKERIAFYSYGVSENIYKATSEYDYYKASYDFNMNQISYAGTTVEMEEYSRLAYEDADECLNKLWAIIKEEKSEEEFAKILDEQRAWLKERDEKGAAVYDKIDGSLATVEYNLAIAEETMNRCEVLLGYLN